MTECGDDSVPPTPWCDMQGRHLWKVRAGFDPGPEHRGWIWQAYTSGPTRYVAMSSPNHHDDYQFARWPSAEDALHEARAYLLEWEEKRPDF